MINYAHLKSQMVQLLDLLRSILYPNVFDAMEEAHSKEELEAAARRQLREILERIYREPPQYDDVIDTLFSKLPAIRDTLEHRRAGCLRGRSRRHLPGGGHAGLSGL